LARLSGGVHAVEEITEGVRGARAFEWAQNTKHIPSLTRTAKYRVPDVLPGGLSSTLIGEVKNVKKLSLTNQLRDYIAYSQQEPRIPFYLYVRESTQLSKPLERAVGLEQILLKRVRFK
jgi:hypothetical protein